MQLRCNTAFVQFTLLSFIGIVAGAMYTFAESVDALAPGTVLTYGCSVPYCLHRVGLLSGPSVATRNA
jgi:hypothetical protein